MTTLLRNLCIIVAVIGLAVAIVIVMITIAAYTAVGAQYLRLTSTPTHSFQSRLRGDVGVHA